MLSKNRCKHCASPKFGQRKRYMSMSGRELVCRKSTTFGLNFKGTQMKLRRGRSGWWWDVPKRQRRAVEERCQPRREILTHWIQQCTSGHHQALGQPLRAHIRTPGQINVQASNSILPMTPVLSPLHSTLHCPHGTSSLPCHQDHTIKVLSTAP